MARFSFAKCLRRLLRRSPALRRHRPANKYVWLSFESLEYRMAPAVTLSIATANVIEPGAGGTANMDFTVTRSGDLGSQLTVGYTTVAGSAQANVDFTPTTGTTTFAYGSSTALIRIPVFGPNAYNHANLTFSVQLTGLVSVVGAPVTLAARTDFSAGTSPIAVAMGDLNGDGRPDLVVANSGDNTVSVFLNTTAPGAAAPSFAVPQTFATGTNPSSVAIADLSGDGKQDLVVADNNVAGTVSVLLNTTAPGATTFSFAGHVDFGTGSNPTSVAIADLNGDGRPDLVTANSASGNVSVLLNTTSPGASTPTFSGDVEFTTGTSPAGVAIGDLNGDGKADLVVANAGSNTVSVLLNTTAPGALLPSFAVKQDFTTGAKPVSVAIGDLNGDGSRDLVVANASANTVSVLLNTTSPGATTVSFAAKQDFATGAGPQSVAIKDLNGDGKLDLIVADAGAGANAVSVLLNTTVPGAAVPTFATQQTFATGGGPASVAVGDLNGDGAPDLVVANNAPGAHSVSVLLNTTVMVEATNMSAFPSGTLPVMQAQPVVIGDINGDGKPDVIVGHLFGNYSVSVLANTTPPGSATATFAPVQNFGAGNNAGSLQLADFNGDGKPDIVVTNRGNNTISVLMNTTVPGSIPSFATQQTFPAGTGNDQKLLAVGDLNGDGKPDVVVANAGGTVDVLVDTTAPGSLTATFAPKQSFATGGDADSVAIADVNGDGKPDLIVANYSAGTVSVLLNTTPPGSAVLSFASPQIFTSQTRTKFVAVADLNGDGKPDVVASNDGSYSESVFLNTTAPGAAVRANALKPP
jgi:hypothetical protein